MKMPSSGDLSRRVTLRKWQDVAAAGFGIDATFDAGATVWASVEPVGSAIFWGTQQIDNGVTHRVTVRRTSAINEITITGEHVAEHDGQRFRVKRASDLNGERRFLVLEVEALGVIE